MLTSKRILNTGAKSNKAVDEFEVLKWLVDKTSLDLEQIPKHKQKHVHAVLFTCFFTQLSEALGLRLSQHMQIGSKSAASCSIECQHL